MLWTFNQHNFAGGRLDKELMGRQDLTQYYKGCSELKNLQVRRQGYVSKRRGTDLVADLGTLIGTGYRLLPLVHEEEQGYYILLTGQKAYLISNQGILLEDGSWALSVGSNTPFSVDIPHGDEELNDIDYTQSGDTVFIACRNHKPAKFVFEDNKITYEEITFSSTIWKKPRIVSVESVANSTWGPSSGDGATNTYYYVCTYVKNGIESEPSEPYGYTFEMPWNDDCALKITCDKGQNETEPDYYNIYKKKSTEYGLLATVGQAEAVKLSPTLASVGTEGVSVIPQRTYDHGRMHYTYAVTTTTQTTDYYVNRTGDNLVVSYATRSVWVGTTGSRRTYYNVTDGATTLIGGIKADDGIVISLGEGSGTVITSVKVVLDAHYNYCMGEGSWYYHNYFSGCYFKATLVCADYDGNQTTFTATASALNPHALSVGDNKKSASSSLLRSLDDDYVRTISFDFYSQLKAKYNIGTSSASATKTSFEVVSIKIEAFVSEEDQTACDLYFNAISFSSQYNNTNEYTDDYIAPDLTYTPPVNEDHFNASGDYPSAVGIYQQRLVFASSDNDPFTFWMSCVGDLYNFNAHSTVREDDAITATLAATEFPQINHIIMNRDLMLFADSGEWQIKPVSGNTLTYKTVSSNMQSAIGCSREVKPVCIGDEIVFAKQTGETLLATRYNYVSDGYESQDLSVMSQWIFRDNKIVSMAYQQHPDQTLWCVLKDGTLAALVYMKEQEVCAWSRVILGGDWLARGVATSKAISNNTTETMLLVSRDETTTSESGEETTVTKWALWKIRDDIAIRTSEPNAADVVCMDGFHAVAAGETIASDMTSVVIDEVGYAGYAFDSELVTVYPDAKQDGGESVQMEIKNATEVKVRTIDGSSFSVGPYGGTMRDVSNDVTQDGLTVKLNDKDARVNLVGNNSKDGRICITHSGIWPLNILSIATTYQIETANQNGGGNG